MSEHREMLEYLLKEMRSVLNDSRLSDTVKLMDMEVLTDRFESFLRNPGAFTAVTTIASKAGYQLHH